MPVKKISFSHIQTTYPGIFIVFADLFLNFRFIFWINSTRLSATIILLIESLFLLIHFHFRLPNKFFYIDAATFLPCQSHRYMITFRFHEMTYLI